MSWFNRARSRGLRPELPAAVPGTSMYPGSNQWGDIPLPLPSATTIEGLPAASRARNMIANAVASMTPFQMWGTDGYVSDAPAPILGRPNATFGLFDFWFMEVSLAIMRGNALAIKADVDPRTGFPNQLVPVPTGFWLAYYDAAGYLVYDIKGDVYSRDEVFHIRANAEPNRPMGVGVVTQFRRSLGQALDQQNFAADTYRSGSIPAGVIELDRPDFDPVQTDAVQAQWVANHSGGRAPAVLPNTMKFVPLQWSPEDLNFLTARQFTVGEIAHMFNLDPTDLGAALLGDAMTYANIEQRQMQRVVDSYAPWMRRLEEEMSDCLPGGNVAKLVPANLQRTDTKTLAETDQLQVGTSMKSTDELRKRDGLKPLPHPEPGSIMHDGTLVPHIPPKPGSPEHLAILKASAPAAPAPAGTPLGPDGKSVIGGVPDAEATGGGVTKPEVIPGTDITETPIKVKA